MGQFTFKSQGAQTPSAAGSLLQSSSYGSTIPKIYGQTQSPLLAIWAANLRQGGSIKKFKQFKKGITSYVENIDFLVGHNPVMGILQVMVNGGNYPLTFTSQSFTASAGAGSYEVTDENFYFVTAVTLEASYSFPVDDYGGTGSQTLTGTFEIPLWNELETGPDPTSPMSYRAWPYCYRWQPEFGATVHIDPETFPGGALKVYYAQLMDATSFQVPIAKLQCAFEPQLGSGSEYADAGSPFDEQQIVYPQFAGLGSSQIDLGASGALPQLLPEVRGKWGVYPSGDADFVDMIEDVFKSGLAQAAIGQDQAYTQMESGLSSYGLPGTVQRKVNTATGVALPPLLYDMPNTPGNVLIAIVKAAGTLTVASSAGDGWAPIFSDGSGWQAWYAIAAGGPNTVTIGGASEPWQMAILEIDMGSPAPPFPSAPSPGANTLILTPSTVMTATGGIGTVTAGIGPPAAALFTIIGDSGFGGSGASTVWGGFTPGPLPADALHIYGTLRAFLDYDIAADVGLIGPFSLTTNGWNAETAFSNMNYADFTAALATFTAEIDSAVSVEGTYDWTGQILNLYLEVTYDTAGPTAVAPGNPIDSVVVTAEVGSSITSTVQQGFPGYLVAVPFYSGNDGPAGMDVAQWDDLTPANFYTKSPSAFQAQGRIVRSPGTYSFETQGTAPSAMALIALKSTIPAAVPLPLGDFIDVPSFDLVRAQCRAYGLWGSLSMNSQSSASDWLKTLCAAANAAPVFLGAKLFLYPYSEVSAAGNGALYTAPTAAGPIANLSDLNGDYPGKDGTPVLETVNRMNLDNVLQMQCIDRNTNYNQVTVQQPDAASIALYGERKGDPVVNNAVQDPTVARSLLGIQVRRNQYGGDVWGVSATARWSLLSPMDLITLTDTLQGIFGVPVRITSWKEQDDHSFAGTAEPFVYGMCAPTPLSTTSPTVNPNSTQVSAGDVNIPIIFEPVPGLYPTGEATPPAELWLVVSSAADNYGGSQVFISTDGGSSYNPAPGITSPASNVITGSAVTGALTADWPAGADPDSTNNLEVDLSESDGTLVNLAVVAENNFEFPCYVEGQPMTLAVAGSTVAAIGSLNVNGTHVADLGDMDVNGAEVAGPGFNYELMTYAIANLTGPNQYTLQATGGGNFLRRAVYDAPTSGEGVDHPIGSRFALLNPSGVGILKMVLPAQYVGQQLFFKICSFNQFGAAVQSQSDVTAYSYTPTGVPGGL